jgi:galactokinase
MQELVKELIHKLATAAVARVPKEQRDEEYNTLHASMSKAANVLAEHADNLPGIDPWMERCLRRMAEQYTTFIGNKKAGRR